MSLLKYIDRIKRMDDLIRRKATGSPDEFAKKLNISRSQLLQDLKEMRELGAPIEFCQTSRHYFYSRECRIILDFNANKNVLGGQCYHILDESVKIRSAAIASILEQSSFSINSL